MSFSSGTFSLFTPGNPVVTGTTIASTWANNTLNDIATGLSTAVLKDGTQTATARIPFAQGISVSTSALPGSDNAVPLGSTTFRWSSLFTPVIDSGTTGSLSLKTNNGTPGFQVGNVASAVNFLTSFPNSTGNGPNLTTLNSSDANVDFNLATRGTGSFNFSTRNDVTLKQQFQILDTASSSRWITVTGSNGGNPTIAASAGSPAINYPAAGGSGTPTSHTLNMYEEGTWTPSVGGTATYTTQTGTYTKIGRMVTVKCVLQINVIGSGSTGGVSGLPFTSSSASGGAVWSWTSLTPSTYVFLACTVPASSTTVTFNGATAAAASISTSVSLFGSGSAISFTMTYEAT